MTSFQEPPPIVVSMSEPVPAGRPLANEVAVPIVTTPGTLLDSPGPVPAGKLDEPVAGIVLLRNFGMWLIFADYVPSLADGIPPDIVGELDIGAGTSPVHGFSPLQIAPSVVSVSPDEFGGSGRILLQFGREASVRVILVTLANLIDAVAVHIHLLPQQAIVGGVEVPPARRWLASGESPHLHESSTLVMAEASFGYWLSRCFALVDQLATWASHGLHAQVVPDMERGFVYRCGRRRWTAHPRTGRTAGDDRCKPERGSHTSTGSCTRYAPCDGVTGLDLVCVPHNAIVADAAPSIITAPSSRYHEFITIAVWVLDHLAAI